MYETYLKRVLDVCLSLTALAVLSPLLLVLTAAGAVAMRGNPFFTQLRPGKDERLFRLIKFRSMNERRDGSGRLLPDAQRLTPYGRLLRRTSLDELPELLNILRGQMSFVGPRPLLPQYLPYYTEAERRRHAVRPGLTGLAQIHGRNGLNWEERFAYDLEYAQHITFSGDLRILLMTVGKVLKKEGVTVRGTGKTVDFDLYRLQQRERSPHP